ncbi:MAG: hypothetical protein ACRD0O_18490 [Acidimicrobiia bacterium]
MPRRPGPRHDHDAGGPGELLERKAALRLAPGGQFDQGRIEVGPPGLPRRAGAGRSGGGGLCGGGRGRRRLGKGGGFSDLEFALAAEAGLIGPKTLLRRLSRSRGRR